MQLTMLGGAQEIGASCYLLEVEGKHILIDAGIRFGQIGKKIEDSLPALDLLEKLDLIVLTHAHSDHTGSLPIIYDFFPATKIICTVPTFPLMMLLFQDAIKLMEQDLIQTDLPLYSQEVINKLNQSIFTCRFGHWFEPFPDRNLRVCFQRAGHILGAASIFIDSKEGKVMFTGDFSLENQRVTKGFSPSSFEPDVIVTETTYGDKKHRSRAEEEKSLFKTVSQVLQNKGKILIPTFALGRAQELLLILKAGQDKKIIPQCPIYVDGMVRTVCHIYEDLIQPNIFFQEGGLVVRVENHEERLQIIDKKSQEPCCVIASSGMLIGGPSVFYAKHLLPGKNNAVLITSYQDEESPGKRILEKGDTVTLDDELTKIRCARYQYDLSAHVDRGGLIDLIKFHRSKAVVLVHGQKDTIQSFIPFLADSYSGKIWSPKVRDTFDPLSN